MVPLSSVLWVLTIVVSMLLEYSLKISIDYNNNYNDQSSLSVMVAYRFYCSSN